MFVLTLAEPYPPHSYPWKKGCFMFFLGFIRRLYEGHMANQSDEAFCVKPQFLTQFNFKTSCPHTFNCWRTFASVNSKLLHHSVKNFGYNLPRFPFSSASLRLLLMQEILHQMHQCKYPILYRVLYIRRRWSPDFLHQQPYRFQTAKHHLVVDLSHPSPAVAETAVATRFGSSGPWNVAVGRSPGRADGLRACGGRNLRILGSRFRVKMGEKVTSSTMFFGTDWNFYASEIQSTFLKQH